MWTWRAAADSQDESDSVGAGSDAAVSRDLGHRFAAGQGLGRLRAGLEARGPHEHKASNESLKPGDGGATLGQSRRRKPMAPDSATLSRTRTAGQKVAHGRIAEPVLVKGRRDFFSYRDLGVADGSAGAMRAQ